MNHLLTNLTQHEYPVLFSLVLAEALGLPVPAALALLVAGGGSAKDPVHFGLVLLTSFSALMLGDGLLFLLGRRTGWWLLGILCRLSLDPDSCILRSAESFRKHGRTFLLFAKFVPGINTIAPPLAGSMNMQFKRFAAYDMGGAAIYALTWCSAGFLFSDFITPLTNGYQAGGRILGRLVAAALVTYFAYHAWLLFKSGRQSYVPTVSASEIARRFYSELHQDMAVYDVRSHGYYSNKAQRIKGSLRLDPNTLLRHIDMLPRDREIILYCTCQREATSLKVARILQSSGLQASVIRGGLRAWKRGHFPMENVPANDIVLLPSF